LVSLAESVRRELSAPLTAVRRDKLQSRVTQALGQLREIVRRSGSRIDRLPAPSRRATVFLSSIDWAHLQVTTGGSPLAGDGRVTWRGLQAFVGRAMDRLAQPLAAEELEGVRQSIERMSRQIEGTIERHKTRAEQLTQMSRELRGWLAFFSRPEICFVIPRHVSLRARRSPERPKGRGGLSCRYESASDRCEGFIAFKRRGWGRTFRYPRR